MTFADLTHVTWKECSGHPDQRLAAVVSVYVIDFPVLLALVCMLKRHTVVWFTAEAATLRREEEAGFKLLCTWSACSAGWHGPAGKAEHLLMSRSNWGPAQQKSRSIWGPAQHMSRYIWLALALAPNCFCSYAAGLPPARRYMACVP